MKKILFVIIIMVLAVGCSGGNRRGSVKNLGERIETAKYEKQQEESRKQRKEEVEKMPAIEKFFAEEEVVEPKKASSIWGTERKSLYADSKASQVGDIVFVILKEEVTAQLNYAMQKTGYTNYTGQKKESLENEKEANKKDRRSGNESNSQDEKETTTEEQILPESNAFDGQGNSSGDFTFDGKITARIEGVDKYGNLYLKGSKLALINNETVVLEISGYVRSNDIARDNTVLSENIDNMEFTYNGAMYLGESVIREIGSNKELLENESESEEETDKKDKKWFFGIF